MDGGDESGIGLRVSMPLLAIREGAQARVRVRLPMLCEDAVNAFLVSSSLPSSCSSRSPRPVSS